LKKIKFLLGYIAVQYTISTRKKFNALVILKLQQTHEKNSFVED